MNGVVSIAVSVAMMFSFCQCFTAKSDETTDYVVQEEISESTYVLNINTKKFHYTTCKDALRIKEENRDYFTGDRDEIISNGYSPCKNCNP